MCIVLSYFIFYGLLSEINLDDDDDDDDELNTLIGVVSSHCSHVRTKFVLVPMRKSGFVLTGFVLMRLIEIYMQNVFLHHVPKRVPPNSWR